ncbi:hypothetical protein [Nostoc sp.]
MTNPRKLLRCLGRTERSRHGQIPFNYEIGLNDFLTVPVMKVLRLEQR